LSETEDNFNGEYLEGNDYVLDNNCDLSNTDYQIEDDLLGEETEENEQDANNDQEGEDENTNNCDDVEDKQQSNCDQVIIVVNVFTLYVCSSDVSV
jgi:hypothetical protein